MCKVVWLVTVVVFGAMVGIRIAENGINMSYLAFHINFICVFCLCMCVVLDNNVYY